MRFGAALTALLLALWAPPAARAADVTVTRSVSQTRVAPGEAVQYSITIQTEGSAFDPSQAAFEKAPAFEELDVMGQPASSRKQNWINGEVSMSFTQTWTLRTREEGTARISAARLSYAGTAYDLAPVEIEVTPDTARATAEDLAELDILAPRSGDDRLDAQLNNRLFAHLSISDESPWLGETIRVRCSVYVDPEIAAALSAANWNPPAWDGFYSEQLPQDRLESVEGELAGRRWSVVHLATVALCPTETGKFEIPAANAVARLRVQAGARRSFHNQFFGRSDPFGMFDETAEVRLPLAPRTIQVRPLPETSRPDSFQGAVGAMQFTGRVDRTEMNEDDFLTLTLEIGGSGYLGGIEEARLPPLNDWERVNAETRTERAGALQSFDGKRVFEILLRPETHGTLEIPAVRYAHFDPDSETYVEQSVGPFTIQVAEAREQDLVVAGGTPGAAARRREPESDAPEQTVYREALAHIHTAPPESRNADAPITAQRWFWALQGLPPLIILAAFGAGRLRERRVRTGEARRLRSAGVRARRELRQARDAMRRGDADAFHRLLAEALRRYMAVKTGRSADGMTLDEIEETSRARGVPSEDAAALRRTLEACDQARYLAASAAGAEDLRQTFAEANRLLAALDKRLQ